MATNNKIITTELDFDAIKTNLKNYLQGQSQFSDYDFEGSGLSILLDVLAYNTHYNALYTNLAINEAFLDSASKRSSVVSKAKELGYTPRSAICATAVVDVVMRNEQIDAPSALEIPRYTPFTAKVNGIEYTFNTTESHIGYKQNSTYTFSNIELKEGSVLTNRFNINANTIVTIPNTGVDLSTLRVIVQPNSQSSNFEVYNRADSLIDVTSTSLVYFVKEIEGQLYQIEFGNDIVGKSLDIGSVVTLTYIVGNTTAPNGVRSFTYNGGMVTNTTVVTSVVTAAYGGSEAEGIESIKWNAPRQYATQNRCVTLEDYKTVIKAQYPNIDSINVWGGELNTPPTYGDVYISIKPADGISLSEAEQNYIINDIIGDHRIVTVHPKFVEPDYLELDMLISFYYNPDETTKTAADLTTLVTQAVLNYNNTYLDQFNGVFRHSHLTRLIDETDQSITNSVVTFHVHRPVTIIFNEAVDYKINLGNPIYNSGVPEESIMTSGFYTLNTPHLCYIEDLPTEGSNIGTLRMFYYSGSQKIAVKNVGTVDYNRGIIDVRNIVVTGTDGTAPKFIIKTQSYDVVSYLNQIVSIPVDNIKVTSIANTTPSAYKFTSSRN